ncbi:MAG TPA: low-specificity L-threonine aldolase [Ktedonobacterales bacterium]|jgi:threonine aldolase
MAGEKTTTGAKDTIDLRSDTVTWPTPAMRAGMAAAEVGDDVYGEDPTVNRLEALAAERVGKDAALFVASGTMGNAIALMSHCRRGEDVVVGDRTHIYTAEVSGAARLNGSMLRAVPNLPDGTLDRARLESAFASEDIHEAPTGLLCLENTHNMCGGRVLAARTLRELAESARRRGLPVHLDGARLFNAAVALGVPAAELAAEADSVMFCLSKGLSAPVGSMLCGTAAFVERARRMRKMLGGGMRQVGVLAAAGIVALEEMVDRLAEDHARARKLAAALARVAGLRVPPVDEVESNFVFFAVLDEAGAVADPSAFIAAARAAGVLLSEGAPGRVRAATHYGIGAAEIERAAEVLGRVARAWSGGAAERAAAERTAERAADGARGAARSARG